MFKMEEVQVPDKCQGCGVQCEAASQLASLLFMKHFANHAGESLLGEEGEAFDRLVEENTPADMADEIKQGVRKMIGDDIADIDEQIEEVKNEVHANELSCSGVLKMRASKGDVSYTVSICTSPRVYNRDSALPQHLPAHVRADSNFTQN